MSERTQILQLLGVLAEPDQDVLEVMNGPEDGRMFVLREASLLIGRSEQADIALLLDASVSRRHARLFWEDACYFVEDTGSMHGTHVNGRPVETAVRLDYGDQVLVGSTLLELRAGRPSPPAEEVDEDGKH